VNAGAQEELAVPALLVAPVGLI